MRDRSEAGLRCLPAGFRRWPAEKLE